MLVNKKAADKAIVFQRGGGKPSLHNYAPEIIPNVIYFATFQMIVLHLIFDWIRASVCYIRGLISVLRAIMIMVTVVTVPLESTNRMPSI